MTKSQKNARLLIQYGLGIALCLPFALANAAAGATEAANTPQGKRLTESFLYLTLAGEACEYRKDAISLYYARELARIIRQEADGPLSESDVNSEAGKALLVAALANL